MHQLLAHTYRLSGRAAAPLPLGFLLVFPSVSEPVKEPGRLGRLFLTLAGTRKCRRMRQVGSGLLPSHPSRVKRGICRISTPTPGKESLWRGATLRVRRLVSFFSPRSVVIYCRVVSLCRTCPDVSNPVDVGQARSCSKQGSSGLGFATHRRGGR